MPIHINNDRDRLISDIKFQKYLPENPNPEFLNDSSSFAFNPCDVLTDSIYFPGGGLDFKQISIYGKFAHSFVYSDYSIEKQDLIDNLSAFVDYSPIHIEELNENKISPHSSKVKIISKMKIGDVLPTCKLSEIRFETTCWNVFVFRLERR